MPACLSVVRPCYGTQKGNRGGDVVPEVRSAWLTGGGGALGQAIARRLAAEGWRGVVTGRDAAEAPKGWTSVPAAIDDAHAAHGAAQACAALAPLALAVCAAGAWEGGEAADVVDGGALERMWQANVATAWNTARAAARAMSPGVAPYARTIVLVSALGALARPAGPGQVAYRAAKGAVAAMTDALAADLAPRAIAVVTLAPSVLDTAQNRRAMPGAEGRRWLSLDDVAGLVAFLATSAAAPLSGNVLALDQRWARPDLP